MNLLDDILLEELYFVISYKDLVQAITWTPEIEENLIKLIKNGWVNQLYYDTKNGDFVKQKHIDNQLENYSYLATKKGLLAHSGL